MSKQTLYMLAGMFLFFLHTLANLPLLAVLMFTGADQQGLNWERAEGTIWYGTIENVSYDQYALGTINLKTFFFPLLAGRVSTQFTINGSALASEGKLTASVTGRRSITGTRLLLDLGRYNIRDAFDAPMSGILRLDITRLELIDIVCRSGEFSLWTDSLKATARRYGGEGFVLSGSGYCENGNIIVPIAGSGDREDVALQVILAGNLDYQAEVRVRSGTPDLVNALRLYGFDSQGDQLVMIQRGNLLTNP